MTGGLWIGPSVALTGASGVSGYNPIAALGSDLLGYWEANRSDLITQSGGLVSSWKDGVAGYNAVQNGGSLKPAYSATSFNGNPGISFDGVDDLLIMSSNPFPSGSSPSQITVLYDQLALVADNIDRVVVSYGNTVGNQIRRVVRGVTSGVNRARVISGNGTTSLSSSNTTVDLTGRHVTRGIFSSIDVSVSVDGGAPSTPTAVVSATGTTVVYIGSTTFNTSFCQGTIAAILIHNPLTSDQDTALMAWLNSRR